MQPKAETAGNKCDRTYSKTLKKKKVSHFSILFLSHPNSYAASFTYTTAVCQQQLVANRVHTCTLKLETSDLQKKEKDVPPSGKHHKAHKSYSSLLNHI